MPLHAVLEDLVKGFGSAFYSRKSILCGHIPVCHALGIKYIPWTTFISDLALPRSVGPRFVARETECSYY